MIPACQLSRHRGTASLSRLAESGRHETGYMPGNNRYYASVFSKLGYEDAGVIEREGGEGGETKGLVVGEERWLADREVA